MLSSIIVKPNHFPPWWCDNINSYMLNNVELSEFGKKGIRRCDVRLLRPQMKPYNDIFRSIMDFAKANIEKFNVDVDYQIDGPIQHITYKTGHYVGWHDDTMTHNMALGNPKYSNLKTDRKLSLTIMLSDPQDYTGGDFLFERGYPLDTKVEGKGTVAMFTSYSQHMVTEITSGVRNILFVFMTGPAWR